MDCCLDFGYEYSNKRKSLILVKIEILINYSNVSFYSHALAYSETLNNEYIERIHQMSYSKLSDNGRLQIFSFLIK